MGPVEFYPGQKVVCVDHAVADGLTLGKVYTVDKAGLNPSLVETGPRFMWHPSRFLPALALCVQRCYLGVELTCEGDIVLAESVNEQKWIQPEGNGFFGNQWFKQVRNEYVCINDKNSDGILKVGQIYVELQDDAEKAKDVPDTHVALHGVPYAWHRDRFQVNKRTETKEEFRTFPDANELDLETIKQCVKIVADQTYLRGEYREAAAWDILIFGIDKVLELEKNDS